MLLEAGLPLAVALVYLFEMALVHLLEAALVHLLAELTFSNRTCTSCLREFFLYFFPVIFFFSIVLFPKGNVNAIWVVLLSAAWVVLLSALSCYCCMGASLVGCFL